MADVRSGDGALFLSDVPAGRGECRFAAAIIVLSTLVFLVLAPFAKTPLPHFPSFILIYQSALLITDLITAAFLFGQSQFSRGKALSVLAAGYLFTALMSPVHALTFPGLFAPTGLLDAGPQTTAWLYMFWHGGFPLFVIAYACFGVEHTQPQRGAAVVISAALVCAVVSGFTLLATSGQGLLPAIMQGNHYTPVLIVVVASVWVLSLLAIALLWRRQPLSILDLWLIVTMCAWLFDIALSAAFNAGRYDLGFYAGRIYGLVAASLILIVLLSGNHRLYQRLVKLHRSDRQKATELERLNAIDGLTGIANRRAFDQVVSEEWRRMLRNATALSLLLIDVDFFKRFNDSYGHVAGDECLRKVALAIASRARRAGELAARYGGEEFAVLLPHIDVAEATKLAELICATVRDCEIPHQHSEVSPYVTVSIGVASISEFPDSAAVLSREGIVPAAFAPGATILVEAADHALYEAKAAGRNRVAVAGPNDAAGLVAVELSGV